MGVSGEYKQEYNRKRYEREHKYWKFKAVRIPVDDMPKLEALAKKERISVNKLILQFIDWGLEQTEDSHDR